MPNKGRQRADLVLLGRKLVPSRAKAKALIEAGSVSADGIVVAKVSQMLASDCQIAIQTELLDWVSRGALKLLAACDAVPQMDLKGAICADIGASTGGFVQVLLSKNADKVYAVDVGRDQLARRLRTHPKVINLEGVNARALTRNEIPEPLDIITCDVSFISLKKALPPILAMTAEISWLVALIKPQFEAGRAAIGKGGVVRDPAVRAAVCDDIQNWAETEWGYHIVAMCPSPIEGPQGNIEFLMVARRKPAAIEG